MVHRNKHSGYSTTGPNKDRAVLIWHHRVLMRPLTKTHTCRAFYSSRNSMIFRLEKYLVTTLYYLQYYVPSTVTPVSTTSDLTKPIKTKHKFSIDPERLHRENMTSHLENMQYLELGDILSQTLENTESDKVL